MGRQAGPITFLSLMLICGRVCVAQEAGAMPMSERPVGLMGPLGAVQLHPIRQALVEPVSRAVVSVPWLRVERSAANIWQTDTPYLLPNGRRAVHGADGQQENFFLDAGLPLGPRLSVGIRLGVSRLWGGAFTDQAIEDFHSQFQFYNFNREYLPVNRVHVAVAQAGGPTLAWDGPRAFFHNPTLTGFWRVMTSRTTQILMRVDGQLPVGDVARTLHLSGPELAVGLSVWQRFLKLAAVHLAGGWLYHGQESVGGFVPYRPQWMGEVSFEVRVLPGMTLLLEDKLQSPLYARGPRLIRAEAFSLRSTSWNASFTPVNLIQWGARWYLPDDTALTMYVGEDFMLCRECARMSRETNAPDLAVSFTLEKALRIMR